ncbi:22472_t:CDS:1 [Dentiscutata erythropus]|uniref:22472_t:CDS:1 n=1 Tax=Dentiscutata erythropus TaxID=1348616 RepID=A0A9N9IT31_9GLOM|nr:22472_t:CDS:1 [Dentiscutata erythropus]
MPILCQRQQRGPYVTKACTNCQQKHVKCTGKATCKYCMSRNLECTFINSGKTRGPKPRKQWNYVLNNSDINFDGRFMPHSVTPNIVQGHTLTFPDNNHTFYSNSYDEFQNIHTPQEIIPLLYQTHTDNTGYFMQNNHFNLY